MTNNKQQTVVKLYTEADLKKVISIYSEEYKTSTDEILKELNLTPIELPTDEEINKMMKERAIESYYKYRQYDWMTTRDGGVMGEWDFEQYYNETYEGSEQ